MAASDNKIILEIKKLEKEIEKIDLEEEKLKLENKELKRAFWKKATMVDFLTTFIKSD